MNHSNVPVRDWAADTLERVTGIDTTKLVGASERDRQQLFERLQSQFEVVVDEVTGSTTVDLLDERVRYADGDRGPASASVAALANRARLLLGDARVRLGLLASVAPNPDPHAVETARRVVDQALTGLIAEFAADAWPAAIDVFLEELLDEDDHGIGGAIGTLEQVLGLDEAGSITTAEADASLVGFLTIRGHVHCVAHGWNEYCEGSDVIESFGPTGSRLATKSECVQESVHDLSTIVGDADRCRDVIISVEYGDAGNVALSTFLRSLDVAAATWQHAASRGRRDVLAVQAQVDLHSTICKSLIEGDALETILSGDDLDTARSIAVRIDVLVDDISETIGSLARTARTAQAADDHEPAIHGMEVVNDDEGDHES